MSEYAKFWTIVCIAGFMWINAVLIGVVFPWAERLLKVLEGEEDETN